MKGSDPAAFTKILGTVFREEREARKLSQNQLAKLSDVGRTGIIFFERGERLPSIYFCKAMADALGMRLSQLVERAEAIADGAKDS